MPFTLRNDSIGRFHHVMNRALGRRGIFETRRDARFFLSLLAREVRRGTLEILAFTILTTHFHLLVRSLTGQLSIALARVERAYVRWFNRSRRRDGPLFRGRFTSRWVDGEAYERAVRLYIDANAVEAGLARVASEYPWCSAFLSRRSRPPLWLSSEISEAGHRAWTRAEQADARWMVEARLGHPIRAGARQLAGASTSSLLSAASAGALDWLKRNAENADGIAMGFPISAPGRVRQVLRDESPPAAAADRPNDLAARRRDAAHAGLLRLLCGLEWDAIARECGGSTTRARRLASRHAEWIAGDSQYGVWIGGVAARVLAQSPERTRRTGLGTACLA